MTDPQPEIVATADLTPEAPEPINLSSPVAIPSLQDQADNLYTMSLSPTQGAPGAYTTLVTAISNGNSQDQGPANTDANVTQGDAIPSPPPATNENNGIEGFQDEIIPTAPITNTDGDEGTDADADADVDEYAKNFDSPASAAEDEGQTEGVSKVNESTSFSTEASHLVKSQPAVETHSTDTSAPTNVVPSTAEPIFKPGLESNGQLEANGASQTDTQREPKQSPVQDTTTVAVATTDNGAVKDEEEESIDIQALVDNITARAAASESNQTASALADSGTNTNPSIAIQSSSLPPRPPTSQQPTSADLRAEELRRFQATPSNATSALPNVPPAAAAMPYPYPAPGTVAEIPGSYAPPATSNLYANPSAPMPMSIPHQFNAAQAPAATGQNYGAGQRYDGFLLEERKYVGEAKWDRFPDGSRLFIGNLSSERVSKKEVFDIFSQYGRLAQISLKQAFGFVQYHTVAEGQAAMDNLQGIEIQGRKIHLEFSRAQKKDGDSDRRGNRGGRGGRDQNDRDRDRFDNRRRDDYRPRSPPSRGRGNHRQNNSYGSDRGHWEPSLDRSRGRSRSPPVYGNTAYRRRTPSPPYRRGPPASEADLDIPRRYANDVPDVQLLLLEEVNREFVNWIQGTFAERHMKVDVMFLNPRFPRELVIQRQVVEGVHGVSELDYRAQSLAKIPLQVFDRSAGRHNARFDQYQDLDPKIAAELVARAKSQAQLQSPAGYGNGQFPPVTYPPPHQQPLPQHYPAQPQPQPPANVNLGGLSNLDNATLQKVLAAMQQTPQGGLHGQPMGATHGVDVNAMLNAIGTGGAPAPMLQQSAGYGTAPVAHGAPQGNPADQAHVQNIMAQLSRYRQ
ncbi:RNA recognition domain-containing protein [Xylariales sp. AK1849]|nr:RNA recognition domain-containing protein [Xylariales sp. AK1849]